MLSFLILGATLFLGVGLHRQARAFVRSRLKYVDAAQGPSVPWIAGGATVLLAGVVTSILPFVGFGSALLLGLAVGTGVAAGRKDIRRATYRLE